MVEAWLVTGYTLEVDDLDPWGAKQHPMGGHPSYNEWIYGNLRLNEGGAPVRAKVNRRHIMAILLEDEDGTAQ